MGINCVVRCAAECAAIAGSSPTFAQISADEANRSINPLDLAAAFDVQNSYTPSLSGARTHTNDSLLRPMVRIAANSVIGVPEIFRGTLPDSTIHTAFIEPHYCVALFGSGVLRFTVSRV